MNLNYKSYWRKTGLKGKWGNIYLERIYNYKPKNFLEIGVFCGVTARNTCDFLKEINLKDIDFVFLDGGHSYQTVYNDLTNLYEHMKDKKKVILCDDYGSESYIPEVEKAINDFRKKNNLQLNLIENRFAEITT